jgi:hypothetical protein
MINPRKRVPDQMSDAVMRQRTAGLNRQSIGAELGCFGHFHRAHCAQNGFIGKCPYQNTCIRETDKNDIFRKAEFNLSSETIKRLRGRK